MTTKTARLDAQPQPADPVLIERLRLIAQAAGRQAQAAAFAAHTATMAAAAAGTSPASAEAGRHAVTQARAAAKIAQQDHAGAVLVCNNAGAPTMHSASILCLIAAHRDAAMASAMAASEALRLIDNDLPEDDEEGA